MRVEKKTNNTHSLSVTASSFFPPLSTCLSFVMKRHIHRATRPHFLSFHPFPLVFLENEATIYRATSPQKTPTQHHACKKLSHQFQLLSINRKNSTFPCYIFSFCIFSFSSFFFKQLFFCFSSKLKTLEVPCASQILSTMHLPVLFCLLTSF